MQASHSPSVIHPSFASFPCSLPLLYKPLSLPCNISLSTITKYGCEKQRYHYVPVPRYSNNFFFPIIFCLGNYEMIRRKGGDNKKRLYYFYPFLSPSSTPSRPQNPSSFTPFPLYKHPLSHSKKPRTRQSANIVFFFSKKTCCCFHVARYFYLSFPFLIFEEGWR